MARKLLLVCEFLFIIVVGKAMEEKKLYCWLAWGLTVTKLLVFWRSFRTPVLSFWVRALA